MFVNSGLGDEVEVFTRDPTIIIKSKSMTDRVRGIVKKSSFTVEDLDELYNTSKCEVGAEKLIFTK